MPAAAVSSRSRNPGCAASEAARIGPRSSRIASRSAARNGMAMMARLTAARGRLSTAESIHMGFTTRQYQAGVPTRVSADSGRRSLQSRRGFHAVVSNCAGCNACHHAVSRSKVLFPFEPTTPVGVRRQRCHPLEGHRTGGRPFRRQLYAPLGVRLSRGRLPRAQPKENDRRRHGAILPHGMGRSPRRHLGRLGKHRPRRQSDRQRSPRSRRLSDRPRERGIYILLTPITTYESTWPDALHDTTLPGFSNFYKKSELGTNAAAISAQVNYIQQLLRHVNPYTGIALKDEPSILFVEMINEPTHHSDDVAGSVAYINALANAVRSTGSKAILCHNVSQDFGIADAIAKSSVQGVTFGWYPTGLNSAHELRGNYSRTAHN